MRILIDYDGTISVKGHIAPWKMDLIRRAIKKGWTVKIYTARKGEDAQNAGRRIKKKFGLSLKVLGGRENFDLFVDEKAGNWRVMKRLVNYKR